MDEAHFVRCRSCGYDLYGIETNRCPECGRPFNPEDPRTFIDPRQIPVLKFTVWAVVFAAMFFAGGTLLSIINELYYSDGYLDDLGWPFPIYTGRLRMGDVVHYDGIILNLMCSLIFGVAGSLTLMRFRPGRPPKEHR